MPWLKKFQKNGLATSTCQNAKMMRSKAFNEIFPTKCFGI